MVFKCPDCGRVKKYLRWKFLDDDDRKEAKEYEGDVTVVAVRCPMCKVVKK